LSHATNSHNDFRVCVNVIVVLLVLNVASYFTAAFRIPWLVEEFDWGKMCSEQKHEQLYEVLVKLLLRYDGLISLYKYHLQSNWVIMS